MKTLRCSNHSDDEKSRIMISWKKMTVSQAMADEPNESEVTVFRKFFANLISPHHQLDYTYRLYSIFRDLLLTSVDIPMIQVPLRDRIPRKIKQAVNRVANQFSDENKSAERTSTF